MSVIGSTLAPAVAPAASTGSQSTGAAGRGSEGTSLSSNAQAALTSASAASVVSLSSDGKSRGASSAEGRKVDGTFDKQEAKGKPAGDKNAGEEGVPKSLDVAA